MNEEPPGNRGPLRQAVPIRLFNLKPKDVRAAGWLLALLAAGVVLLTVHPGASGGSHPTAGSTAPASAAGRGPASGTSATAAALAHDPLLAEEEAISARLQTVLSRVAGVGAVSVEVDLTQGPATDYAVNSQVSDATTAQPGGAGGQTTTQHTEDGQVVLSGAGQPAVRAVQGPVIAGVVVVAAGASDPVVGEEITQAVEAATGVPAYRIVVLPAAGGGN